MCGRFVAAQSADDVFDETGLWPPAEWRPHYNVAPSQPVLVVRTGPDGAGRALATLRWGFRSSGAARLLINARAESVAAKPTFRAAFRARRCAIVASGFYEWRRGDRTPFYFAFAAPTALAGLWEEDACVIVTTAANATVAPIHDRMPALIARGDVAHWIDPRSPAEALTHLLTPAPDATLFAHAVSRAVNDPKNDAPSLIDGLIDAHG